MRGNLRVALVNRLDVRSVHVLSGTPYFMMKALGRHDVTISQLGPVSSGWMNASRYLHGAARVIGRSYDWHHSLIASYALGRRFSSLLKNGEYDLIFAPFASTEIAFLNTDIPIVYLTDMTVALGQKYYGSMSRLLPFTANEGSAVERRAVRRAAKTVAPSAWVANSIKVDYNGDPAHVHVISFGANLADPPLREEALAPRDLSTCRLLFLGVSWERKGGAIALQVLKLLCDAGVDAELVVCGCQPPPNVFHSRMRVVPFLSKQDPDQALQLRRLLLESSFLIVPSRAEAWGMVFAEASASGLPSIATDTGGVSAVVRDGINGICLPYSATPDEYVQRIKEILFTSGCYRRFTISARDEYESRLNWDSWANEIVSVFSDAIARCKSTVAEYSRGQV